MRKVQPLKRSVYGTRLGQEHLVHPAYSNWYNLQKTTGVTQSDIFSQIDLCGSVCRMGGDPVFHIITMINIDVLEQWWLA